MRASTPHIRPAAPTPRKLDPMPAGLEMELRGAIEEYKQISGRMFPTWCEVLEVVRSLGYAKPGMEAVPASPIGAWGRTRPAPSPAQASAAQR